MDRDNLKDYFDNYKGLIKIASAISTNFNESVNNNGRLLITVPAFSKLLLTYTTLLKLIPLPDGSFDISSISSIVRVFIELSNKLFFFGIEQVSDEELDFRLAFYNYLSVKDRFCIAKWLDAKNQKLTDFRLSEEEVSSFKQILEDMPFFKALVEERKIIDFSNLIKEGHNNKYFNRTKIQEKRGIDNTWTNNWMNISSKFIHSSPAIIDQHRNYLSDFDEASLKDQLTAVIMIEICSDYFATTILELRPYIKNWETIISIEEINLIRNYSNRIKTVIPNQL